MRVYLSPGHGGSDTGAMAADVAEKSLNLAVARLVDQMLQAHGVETMMARTVDAYVPISARTNEANDAHVDAYVSIHHNAAPNRDARGTEVYHTVHSASRGPALAKAIADRLAACTDIPPRGTKTRTGSGGMDYYHEIRETRMPSVIVEIGYLTNPDDLAYCTSVSGQYAAAQGIAQGILQWAGVDIMGTVSGTPILSAPSATVGQALLWAKNHDAAPVFVEYLPLYWQIAPEYGVDPAVAAAQSAKETAYGRFGGAVTPDQHNPCGLKITKPTGDRRDDHATFPDWATGVRAHLQHLALYAGVTVQGEIVDPRHFDSIEGTAKTVEALGGRWAPSADYGRSIVREYLEPLRATSVPERVLVPIADSAGHALATGWDDGEQVAVHVRDLAEALGLVVEWHDHPQSVILRWPGKK